MAEITYEELQEQIKRLDPWVGFLVRWQGDEISNQWECLIDTADICRSAQDYEAAKVVLDLLESRIKEASQSEWWHEMINESRAVIETRRLAPPQVETTDIDAEVQELPAL